MPISPPSRCREPGCRVLVRRGPYCETHAPAHKRKAWASVTTSSTSRGYGAHWQKLRLHILAKEPICSVCGRMPSQHVDHITPKAQGGGDEEENLRGICAACHAKKTARDRVSNK